LFLLGSVFFALDDFNFGGGHGWMILGVFTIAFMASGPP
jgi:hypothetical protein